MLCATLVDDFALKPLRSPHDEDFHELIAERYERRSTILTSNLAVDEWADAFPANRMLGAATVDRLRHGAYSLELAGPTYRAPNGATAPGPATAQRRNGAAKTTKSA